MGNIFLSVIIPCYNEEKNLRRGVLSDVADYLKKQKYSYEVIISDDGSTDKSKDLIKKQLVKFKNFRLLENDHGGKLSALNYGILKSKGKYVLFDDMDQSTPINELEKLVDFALKGFSVVIGSRGLVRKDFPVYRKLGALAFSGIRRSLILPEIIDTQCGFKLVERNVAAKYFPKLEFIRNKSTAKGWRTGSWDVEFLHILKKNKFKIKEVGVKWNDRDISTSKGGGFKKYLRESGEMLAQILRVKLNDLKGRYKNG